MTLHSATILGDTAFSGYAVDACVAAFLSLGNKSWHQNATTASFFAANDLAVFC